MTQTHTNFLGIPVEGEITRSSRTEQRPREEFEAIVKDLLEDPTVVDFGWRQYTPYFNDGDTCEFGAHGLWVRTSADVGTPADVALGVSEPDDDFDEYKFEVYNHPTLAGESKHRAESLDVAIDRGHFDDVLLDLFGDHAEVRVRRTGISVTTYEHD